MMAEQEHPFDSDENDGLGQTGNNVSSIHKDIGIGSQGKDGRSTIPHQSTASLMKAKLPKWVRSPYFIGTSGVFVCALITALLVGPKQFGIFFEELTFPTLNDGNVKSDIWQAKLQELAMQQQGAERILNAKMADIKGSVDQAVQAGVAVKGAMEAALEAQAAVELMSRNFESLLKRINQLEQDVLLVATTSGGEALEQIQGEVGLLKGEVTELTSIADKVTKNDGWHSNRLEKLESWMETVKQDGLTPVTEKASNTVSASQPIKLAKPAIEKNQWVLRAASFKNNIGFLLNIYNNRKLRVSIGTEVPNCGRVLSMDAGSNSVITEHCSPIKKG